MTISQTISNFPTPLPDRDEDTPLEFSDHVDDYINHLNTHISEVNTWADQANPMADAMNIEIGSMYVGTSSTSVAIGTGAKTFTVNESGKAFAAGASIHIVNAANPNTKSMTGTVTSYNTGTKSLVINVVSVEGSGTLSNWLINVGGACNRIQGVSVATDAPTNKQALIYNSTSEEYEPGTDIGTHEADIATNTADISTNETGIATNVTNIATNVTNIATNVTNIATNGAKIDKNENNIIIEAFRRMLGDAQAGADAFQDGWVDALVDNSSIDTGNSTNYYYDASGDYVTNLSAPTSILQNTGGSHGYLGDIGDEERRDSQSFTLSGRTRVIAAKIHFGVNSGTPTGNVTFRIETDSAGLPSGSLAHASATKALSSITESAWNTATFASSFILTAGTYWLVPTCANQSTDDRWRPLYVSPSAYAGGNRALSTDGGSSWTAYTTDDMRFEISYRTVENMQLVFNAYEAEGEPDESKILFIMEPIDTITLGTDIKAYASLDNGVNYEQITLEDIGDFETDHHIITGTEVLTDRNDQTTKIKTETLNNKELRIHQVANFLHLQ